eukprot:4072877-Pleurochrysis_carterae.AAC.1
MASEEGLRVGLLLFRFQSAPRPPRLTRTRCRARLVCCDSPATRPTQQEALALKDVRALEARVERLQTLKQSAKETLRQVRRLL